MSRFWHLGLAIFVTAAMISAADAQSNGSAEIGSYQDILARAGYRQNAESPDSPIAHRTAVRLGTQVRYPISQATVPDPPGHPPKPYIEREAIQGGWGTGSGSCSATNCGGAPDGCGSRGECGTAKCCNGNKRGLLNRLGGRDCDSNLIVCDSCACGGPGVTENIPGAWGGPHKIESCDPCGAAACSTGKPVGLLKRLGW